MLPMAIDLSSCCIINAIDFGTYELDSLCQAISVYISGCRDQLFM